MEFPILQPYMVCLVHWSFKETVSNGHNLWGDRFFSRIINHINQNQPGKPPLQLFGLLAPTFSAMIFAVTPFILKVLNLIHHWWHVCVQKNCWKFLPDTKTILSRGNFCGYLLARFEVYEAVFEILTRQKQTSPSLGQKLLYQLICSWQKNQEILTQLDVSNAYHAPFLYLLMAHNGSLQLCRLPKKAPKI